MYQSDFYLVVFVYNCNQAPAIGKITFDAQRQFDLAERYQLEINHHVDDND